MKNSISILVVVFFLIFLKPPCAKAQHKNTFEAGLYNIGFGGLIGGIGAVINKKPAEKFGKVFLKGVGQGALGGYLLFESKRLVAKFSSTGNYGYVWPSKLVNAAGTSIIENAASNRNFWERWHINIGFNRLDFYIQRKFKVSYRVMPIALSATFHGFSQGGFHLSESIKTGTFVFKSFRNRFNKRYNFFPLAETASNSIIIYEKSDLISPVLIAHELIHVYQYENFSGINSFLNKPTNHLISNKKWAKIYHKIFYSDFNFLYSHAFYVLNSDYESKFSEKEAQWYSNLYIN